MDRDFGPKRFDRWTLHSLTPGKWYTIHTKEGGRFHSKIVQVNDNEILATQLVRVYAPGGPNLEEREGSITLSSVAGYNAATEDEVEASKSYTYPFRVLLGKPCRVEKGDRTHAGILEACSESWLILKPYVLFSKEPLIVNMEEIISMPFDAVYAMPWDLEKELERLKEFIARDCRKPEKKTTP